MLRFRRSALMAAFATATLVAFPCFAQTPAGNCVRDSFGKVICGKGQCALDQYGKVHCAKEGGGGALRNQSATYFAAWVTSRRTTSAA